MDTCSSRIVGWSIDTVQDSQLVVNALDSAIRQRRVKRGGIVHVDHGVQGEFNRLSQHPITTEVSSGSWTTSSGLSKAAEDEVARESFTAARSRKAVLD